MYYTTVTTVEHIKINLHARIDMYFFDKEYFSYYKSRNPTDLFLLKKVCAHKNTIVFSNV